MKLLNLLILIGILYLIASASAATTIEFNPVPVNPYPPVTFNYTVYTTGLTNGSFILANITYPRLDLVVSNCFKNNTNINGISFTVINLTSTVSSLQVNATNTSQLFSSGATRESLFDIQFRAYNSSFSNNDSVPFDISTTQWYGNTSTKDTGYNTFGTRTNGWINSTVLITSTRLDIWMAGAYPLHVTVTDSEDGTALIGVSVVDSSGQNVTTDAAGLATLYEPYSSVAGALYKTGYVSRGWSIVVDNETWVTYQMTPSTAASSQNTWWTPHTVQITLYDAAYQFKLVGVNLTAHYNASSMPTAWINDLYGIQTSAGSDMVNRTLILGGITGSDGTLTTTMLGSLSYDIYLTSAQYGLDNYHVQAYPADNQLNIYVPTSGSILPTNRNSSYRAMNSTRVWVSEPNISYVTMHVDYQDSYGITSYVNETWKFANNNTIVYSVNITNPGTDLILNNYTVPNIRGAMYWWGYNASRSE